MCDQTFPSCDGHKCDFECFDSISPLRIFRCKPFEAARWLIAHGLLRNIVCCGVQTELCIKPNQSACAPDEWSGIPKLRCQQCWTRYDPRNGTFFAEATKTSLTDMIGIIWATISGHMNQQALMLTYKLAKPTVSRIMKAVTKIGSDAKKTQLSQMEKWQDGEWDETAFGKRKYHRGRRQRAGGTCWVQGGCRLEVIDGRQRVTAIDFEHVAGRSAEDLLPAIVDRTAAGGQVATDALPTYHCIGRDGSGVLPGVAHAVVNHQPRSKGGDGFKNDITGACTSRIEGLNAVVKKQMRKRNHQVACTGGSGDLKRQKLDVCVLAVNCKLGDLGDPAVLWLLECRWQFDTDSWEKHSTEC